MKTVNCSQELYITKNSDKTERLKMSMSIILYLYINVLLPTEQKIIPGLKPTERNALRQQLIVIWNKQNYDSHACCLEKLYVHEMTLKPMQTFRKMFIISYRKKGSKR